MYFLQARFHSIATAYNKANINECISIFNAFNKQQAHVIDVITTANEHQHQRFTSKHMGQPIMHELNIFFNPYIRQNKNL